MDKAPRRTIRFLKQLISMSKCPAARYVCYIVSILAAALARQLRCFNIMLRNYEYSKKGVKLHRTYP